MWARFHSYVGLVTWVWLLTHFNTLSFCLSSPHFFITFRIHLNITHPTILHLSRCRCGHTIDDLNIHLLYYLCNNERIATHDTFQDTIVIIMLKNGAHVQREVSHFFPHHTRRWMDIVITRNNFQTLANIIIINLTCTNLAQRASMMTAHVIIVATQDKAQSYTPQVPGDDFIPLAIETYDCLHPRFDSFFTSCLHANIACHQQTSLVPSMLIFIGNKCR